MTLNALPAPDWAAHAWRLATSLLAFDPRRLRWALALRTVMALALPLLAAHALKLPLLVWAGLGAYLLAIGDSVDDGDRAQFLRIIVGAALGGLALTTGVLAGGNLAAALAGMLGWGLVTGMMGVYGNAFASMSLPIAWAYVELGLPASTHALPYALAMGGAFMLGGVLTLILTLALRFGGPLAPVRAQTAACFRAIAGYPEADQTKRLAPPEQHVRGAIAEARRLAAQARQSMSGPSRANQRVLVLIEVADRLYSLTGALRETGEPLVPACKSTLLVVARFLEGQAKPEDLRRLRVGLDYEFATGAPEGKTSILGRRMIQELRLALSVALDDERPAFPKASAPPARRLAALLSPLAANLNRESITARHALRFALVTSAAVAVFWVFPKPFGYWVPLTATVVLKPSAGMTLARAVQRAAGTAVGIVVGLALLPVLPGAALKFTAVIVLFFWMMAVLPFNYGLAVFFLSAGLIPFEHVLTPGIHAAIGTYRLIATAIGSALALIGGHVLWPTFERRELPDTLHNCIAAMAAYADNVLGAALGDAAGDPQAQRRRAGLALSNLQAGVQRSLTEIGGDMEAMTTILRASVALQRLSNTLNMLLQAAPEIARSTPALTAFRAAFVAALANPWQQEPPITVLQADIPLGDHSPEGEVLAMALDRLTSALEMLHDAGLRLKDI